MLHIVMNGKSYLIPKLIPLCPEIEIIFDKRNLSWVFPFKIHMQKSTYPYFIYYMNKRKHFEGIEDFFI